MITNRKKLYVIIYLSIINHKFYKPRLKFLDNILFIGLLITYHVWSQNILFICHKLTNLLIIINQIICCKITTPRHPTIPSPLLSTTSTTTSPTPPTQSSSHHRNQHHTHHHPKIKSKIISHRHDHHWHHHHATSIQPLASYYQHQHHPHHHHFIIIATYNITTIKNNNHPKTSPKP